MKVVLEILAKEILPNSTVVLACSGGPDSMCLLDLLQKIALEKNLKIILAHVNHRVRKASDQEEEFLITYAKK